MVTIGVAIAIPEPFGEYLRGRRLDFGDQMATKIPSHITLAPPIEIDQAALGLVEKTLVTVAAGVPAFEMVLRGTGSFRPVSQVAFVAVSEGIAPTEVLAKSIGDSLQLPDPEFPFHPHVTVAHNVEDAALDRAVEDLRGFSCRFQVTEVSLYTHDDGDGWTPIRTFGLAPGLSEVRR